MYEMNEREREESSNFFNLIDFQVITVFKLLTYRLVECAKGFALTFLSLMLIIPSSL